MGFTGVLWVKQSSIIYNQHDVSCVYFCAGWVYLNLHADGLDPRMMFFFFFTCTLLLLSLHGFERCFESLCRCLPCKVQQQKEVLPGPLLALGWFESCFKHSKSDSNCKGETYGNVLDPPIRPVIWKTRDINSWVFPAQSIGGHGEEPLEVQGRVEGERLGP